MSNRTFPIARLARHAAVALLLVACTAPLARAQELIEPRTKDRKFPVGLWCPIALDLQFTANASSATIRFSTNVFWDDGGTLRWSQQYLDNICVAPHDVFVNNQVDPGDYSANCYTDSLIPKRFAFQTAGAIPLKELFASNPSGTWDLSHGAYWRSDFSAPSNPGVENDSLSSGSLGMGQDSQTPSASDSAITSVVITGLLPGQSYDLSGWWDVHDSFLASNSVFLTVHITGPGATPIVTKTWGALKRQYR